MNATLSLPVAFNRPTADEVSTPVQQANRDSRISPDECRRLITGVVDQSPQNAGHKVTAPRRRFAIERGLEVLIQLGIAGIVAATQAALTALATL